VAGAGAYAELARVMARHDIVVLNAASRGFLLDIIEKRLERRDARSAALTALLKRFDTEDELPVYIGDYADLFRDLFGEATQRRVEEGVQDWLEGTSPPEEILRALGLEAMDLMAVLDAQGAGRTAEQMRLTDARRAELLARVRAERLARGGKANLRPDLVARDVVASQRIEDVDARRILFDDGA
jgi:hypothetical protein